jgi:sRNA-binding carbon storage regulator CsrA
MVDYSKITLTQYNQLVKDGVFVPFDVNNPKDIEALRTETIAIIEAHNSKAKPNH